MASPIVFFIVTVCSCAFLLAVQCAPIAPDHDKPIVKVLPSVPAAVDRTVPDHLSSPSRSPRHTAAVVAAGVDIPEASGRGVSVHISDGAYPVYYSVARTNGRFGKRIRAYGRGEYEQMQRDSDDGSAAKAADSMTFEKASDIRK